MKFGLNFEILVSAIIVEKNKIKNESREANE
jgi:hypothetical protein